MGEVTPIISGIKLISWKQLFRCKPTENSDFLPPLHLVAVNGSAVRSERSCFKSKYKGKKHLAFNDFNVTLNNTVANVCLEVNFGKALSNLLSPDQWFPLASESSYVPVGVEVVLEALAPQLHCQVPLAVGHGLSHRLRIAAPCV